MDSGKNQPNGANSDPQFSEWDKIEEDLEKKQQKYVDYQSDKKDFQVFEGDDSEKPQTVDGKFIVDLFRKKNMEEAGINPENNKSPELTQYEQALQQFIFKNMVGAARARGALLDGKLTEELVLNLTIAEDGLRNKGEVSDRNSNTDRIRGNIDNYDKQLEELGSESRDSYYVMKGFELRENLKELKNGKMVNTPYVQGVKRTLQHNMATGQPTFIYGHLGSGKTEIAINATRDFAMQKAAEEAALKDVENYFKSHPEEAESYNVVQKQLVKAYKRNYAKNEQEFRDGDSSAVDRFVPLVISGSKDLTTQDLYTEKSLKLTHFNGKALAEHKDEYDAEFEDWKNANDKRYDDLPEDERKIHEARDEEEFFNLYKMKNQAFGTEVDIIQKELYKAVAEGRPVVLDEVNAIPAGVLISLNDVLQRRPGDNCYIPGVGSIEIKPGFSITMTGNLNSGRNEYAGVNDFNVAFLSRLDIIEYDYLPQSTEGSFEEREPQENELYQVMIEYLADEKGNLRLPEIDKNVKKLYSLAQLARLSQEIFSGEDYHVGSGGDEKSIRFEKSVLSVRNMLQVLNKWNKGAEMDLDTALYKGFIAGMVDENERNSMLQLAHDRYGFFDEGDGWNFVAKNPGENCTFGQDNSERLSSHERKPLETYITAKVVDLIYGDRPDRESYPDIDFDKLESTDEDSAKNTDENIDDEKYAELLGSKEMAVQTAQALEVLAEQCGCSND